MTVTMQMNMLWITLTIIFSLWICPVHARNTIKYGSSCSVDLCTLINASNSNNTNNNNGNVSCPNLPVCYLFDTSINTSICAPQVICSLYDACTTARRCATNTSVCVINTCCSAPVCMPLSLTTSCSMYTTNNMGGSSSNTICPNATWAANSTIVINAYVNSNSYVAIQDFFIDNNNNIYMTDTYNSRILQSALNNPPVISVAAVTNASSSYQPSNVFVDTNGTIYTTESWYSTFAMVNYYRIFKYTQNGVANGTIIYGPATCATGLGDMCWCAGLFVDGTGSIYYSDQSNHRVLKITPFASSATVVAGITGSYGASLNQLNNPAGIYVDGTGALYVADQSNYRVMKFASGSLSGTNLFTLASYQAPIAVMLDNAGSVYAGTYNGVFKYVPASSSTVQVASSGYWGITRIRFDTFGNMYTSGYSSSNIYRYNITANSC